MAVLNHHIVAVHDRRASARYYTETLGLKPALELGAFEVVRVSDDTTLDFIETDAEIVPQHYAFLVTEEEFDTIFDRVRGNDQTYWADPMHRQPGEINHWDDGRGVYFDDPDGHRLEIITRPYGSAGTGARHVHPLVAPVLDGDDELHRVH